MKKTSNARVVAATILALTLIASPASGTHTHGEGAGDNPFNPLVDITLQRHPSAPSDVRLVVTQTEHEQPGSEPPVIHEQPVIDFLFRFPLEWGFDPEVIRPAEKWPRAEDESPTAATCEEMMLFTGSPEGRLQPSAVRRAEHLGTVELRARTNMTREGAPRAPTWTGGLPGLGPSGTSNQAEAPNDPFITFGKLNSDLWHQTITSGALGLIAFRDWDDEARRADLCIYAFAQDGRADAPQETPNQFDRSPREHLFPATLTKTETAWELRFDLRSLYTNEFLASEEISVTSAAVYLNGFSSGRWQADCGSDFQGPKQCDTSGQEGQRAHAARVVFSRTPQEIGDYEIESLLTTCIPNEMAANGPCPEGTETVVVRRTPFQIVNPSATLHELARLRAPAPFAVFQGTDEVDVRWEQPVTAPGHRVKGYLVTTARPHQQDTRHFDYLITEPLARLSAGLSHTTNPCGENGNEPECGIRLKFPLQSISGKTLSPNEKYIVSIVTIYSDGHRTDGFCDDGSPGGVVCSPANAGFPVSPPGLDFREFFLSEIEWPLVYQAPSGGQSSPDVLFVDFDAGRAAFLLWSRGDDRNQLYRDGLRQIAGSNEAGGVVVFGGPTHLDRNHLFTGYVTSTSASGDLITYDRRGFPNDPNGLPSAQRRSFSGARIT